MPVPSQKMIFSTRKGNSCSVSRKHTEGLATPKKKPNEQDLTGFHRIADTAYGNYCPSETETFDHDSLSINSAWPLFLLGSRRYFLCAESQRDTRQHFQVLSQCPVPWGRWLYGLQWNSEDGLECSEFTRIYGSSRYLFHIMPHFMLNCQFYVKWYRPRPSRCCPYT